MQDHYRPCIMDTGYFADSRRLTASVVRDNALVGYVSMLVGETSCGLEEMEAIAVIADALAIYLQTQQSRSYDRLSLRRFFARSLMQGEMKDAAEVKKWTTLLGLPFAPRYVLLALAPNRTDRQHFGYYIQDQLEETGLPLLLDPSDRFLYVLLYAPGTGLTVRPSYGNWTRSWDGSSSAAGSPVPLTDWSTSGASAVRRRSRWRPGGAGSRRQVFITIVI